MGGVTEISIVLIVNDLKYSQVASGCSIGQHSSDIFPFLFSSSASRVVLSGHLPLTLQDLSTKIQRGLPSAGCTLSLSCRGLWPQLCTHNIFPRSWQHCGKGWMHQLGALRGCGSVSLNLQVSAHCVGAHQSLLVDWRALELVSLCCKSV